MATGWFGNGSFGGSPAPRPASPMGGANTSNPMAPTGGGFSPSGLYGTGPGGYNPNIPSSPTNPGPSNGVSAMSLNPYDAAQNALLAANQPQLDAIRQGQGWALAGGALQSQLYGVQGDGLRLSYQDNINDLNTNMDTKGMQRARSLADADAYARMMGFNTDVFNNQASNLGNAAMKQLAGINSDATAKGAFTASGTNDSRRFNAVDFFTNYGALEGNYKQQQESLGMRQGNAQTQADILAREASNLGTKPALLQAQLDNGLAKLGLQNSISTADLLQGIAKGNQQAAAIYLQILQQSKTYGDAATGRG